MSSMLLNADREITPLVDIHFGGGLIAKAKLEKANHSQSHKQRMANDKVRTLLRTGKIGNGKATLIISSSGRAGQAFAEATLSIPDVELKIVTDVLSPVALTSPLALFPHVELIVVDRSDDTGSHLAERLRIVDRLKENSPNPIVIDQYADSSLPFSYMNSLVQEVIDQTNGRLSTIFVPCGTCATLRAFDLDKKANNRSHIIVPVDAEGSSLFRPSRGCKRSFSGYGNGGPTQFAKECEVIAPPIHVDDVSVARMANWLLTKYELSVGPSSAAAATAFIKATYSDILPHWGTPVLIFPDDGQAYRNTIFNDDWLIENDLGRAVAGP